MEDYQVFIIGVACAGFILLVLDKVEQYIDAKYKWKALDFEEFESIPKNVEAIREYRLNPRSKKSTQQLEDCFSSYFAEILEQNTHLLRKSEQGILRFLIKRYYSFRLGRYIAPEEILASQKHAFISNYLYVPLRKSHESDD
jgi:hypothetical protein